LQALGKYTSQIKAQSARWMAKEAFHLDVSQMPAIPAGIQLNLTALRLEGLIQDQNAR
jgi:hypothetical protein